MSTTVDRQTSAAADLATGLKAAMRRLPAAVSLITTRDTAGQPVGLAASAVMSASLDPPTVFISVNRNAGAYGDIQRSGQFCVNILAHAQRDLVGPFADSALREHRFTHPLWAATDGLPYLADACANIFCTVDQTVGVGTHDLFVGRVFDVRTNDQAEPLGWLDGGFARIVKATA